MVEHQSKEVVDKIAEVLKIQPATAFPKDVKEGIQPVFDINPERITTIVVRQGTTSTNTLTVFTTPANQDFYLTSAQISYTKDVSSDNVAVNLTITPELSGAADELIELVSQTLTVKDDHSAMNFSQPIKLQRGSTITLAGGFTVGTMTKVGIITGYSLDPL